MKEVDKKLISFILILVLTPAVTLAAYGKTVRTFVPENRDDGYGSVLSVEEIPEEKVPEIGREHDEKSVLIKLCDDASLDELNRYLRYADSVKPCTVREEDVHSRIIFITYRS